MASFPRALRWFAAAALLFAFILVPFAVFEPPLSEFASALLQGQKSSWGTVVVVGAFMALDVVLPVPSSILNTYAGAALGFTGAMLACWAGMTVSCLLGYLIGLKGGVPVLRRLVSADAVERARGLAGPVGVAMIVIARPIPVLAEASTIAAGAARFPLRRFLALTVAGNAAISAVYATFGAYAIAAGSFTLSVIGAIGMPLVLIAAHRLWTLSRRGRAAGAEPDSG